MLWELLTSIVTLGRTVWSTYGGYWQYCSRTADSDVPPARARSAHGSSVRIVRARDFRVLFISGAPSNGSVGFPVYPSHGRPLLFPLTEDIATSVPCRSWFVSDMKGRNFTGR